MEISIIKSTKFERAVPETKCQGLFSTPLLLHKKATVDFLFSTMALGSFVFNPFYINLDAMRSFHILDN